MIFLYMEGGPSQVDTFDPKPRLDREHGQPFGMKIEPTQFNNNGKTLASPWKFRNYGAQRHRRSATCSRTSARRVDELAVVRSMTSQVLRTHQRQLLPAHRRGLQGRPSMGAWVTYGLGSECQDLPGFVVLNGGLIPPGGLDNFNSGFLPATYQGSIFEPGGDAGGEHPADSSRAARPAEQARLHARSWIGRSPRGRARRRASNRPSPTTRWRTACRRPCPS